MEDTPNTMGFAFIHHLLVDAAISVDLYLVQVPLTRIISLQAGASIVAIFEAFDELEVVPADVLKLDLKFSGTVFIKPRVIGSPVTTRMGISSGFIMETISLAC